MRTALALILSVVAAGLSGAQADELDEWCAQAKKASSIVICSDAELRQQAIVRNKLFEAARAKLGPVGYKALTEDQSRWIKSYTARCGVSLDDPPPPIPIPQGVVDCYRRESRARTAYLTDRLSEPNPAGSSQSGTTAGAPLPRAEDLLRPPSPSVAEPSRAPGRDPALDNWMSCLMDAAKRLADQPEPARTVTEAALGNCGKYEVAYGQANRFDQEAIEKIKRDAVIPKLLALVMSTRKAQQGAVESTPAPSRSEASDVDLDKWIQCTLSAIDTLADQPEPAQTVAHAAFGSCLDEELAYQKSARLSDRQLEELKAAVMAPRALAQVMAIRAARAKLREQSPASNPAIDYGRM